MRRALTFILSAGSLAAGGLVAAVALAGPLSPSPGPISPTYKTLSEVEPRTPLSQATTPGDADSVFRITQPGSYYLTGNITVPAGRSGIEIASSGVTIDLNGFTISGAAGALSGIVSGPTTIDAITIRDGAIVNMGQLGIAIVTGGAGVSSRIEGVSALRNADTGIHVGHNAVVESCVAAQNGRHGIDCADNAVVRACTAFDNEFDGIRVGRGSAVTDSAVRSNLTGLNAGDGSSVQGVAATFNSVGILLGESSSAINCTADLNAGNGILADFNAHVERCVLTRNGEHGVSHLGFGIIRGNTCVGNGVGPIVGAGVRVFTGNCRVEDNHCIENDRGIEIGGTASVVLRKTCADNLTNWIIAANNVFGPIIDRRSPASAAVNGNSAASSLGSTDANANFTH